MPDELFSPTITDRPHLVPAPWRPESIFYPAFFGGPLAAATLGVLNGRRLRLRPGVLALIAVAGAAAIVARIAVTAAVDSNSSARIVGSGAGVLVWLVTIAVQRRPFRAFCTGSDEPASLVAPGFAAAIGCGLFEAIVIYGLVR